MRDERGALLIGNAAEVREMDRRTIDDVGMGSLTLMEAAGAGTARQILERKGSHPQNAVVLCGSGNNGGDGYVVARHLADAGWSNVVCIVAGLPERLTTDAAFTQKLWREVCHGETLELGAPRIPSLICQADVIVDGLFGTGLSRPIQGPQAELIRWANDSAAYRVALDLPSGVMADTGRILEPAFRADLTTPYGVSKFGLHQFPGAGICGEVSVVTIGLPRRIVEAVGARGRLITEKAATMLLPRRAPDGHKGSFGHVGVVGGAPGMEGAAIIAALGALRVGAGLATWNRPSLDVAPTIEVSRPPELMLHELSSIPAVDARSGVLVVGPGLGRDRQAALAFDAALGSGRPVVIDADGLHILGRNTPLRFDGRSVILTPHPAEAATLLGVTVSDIQADRPSAAEALVDRYNSVVILKGASSVVAAPGRPLYVVDGGQPALSVAGSGDVLAGVCAGLLGQGLTPFQAAQLGVFVHARAGDRVACEGAGRGALAGEIAAAVRDVVGDLEAARAWV